MVWATCCLGFFGFLKAGRVYCQLQLWSFHTSTCSGIASQCKSPPSLNVHIKSSKTDPFWQCSFVCLGRGWYSLPNHRNHGLSPTLGVLTGSPLHWLGWSDFIPFLAGNSFREPYKQQVFLDGSLTSFSTGPATTAAQHSIPDHLHVIKTMGRGTSNAYQLYSM